MILGNLEDFIIQAWNKSGWYELKEFRGIKENKIVYIPQKTIKTDRLRIWINKAQPDKWNVRWPRIYEVEIYEK